MKLTRQQLDYLTEEYYQRLYGLDYLTEEYYQRLYGQAVKPKHSEKDKEMKRFEESKYELVGYNMVTYGFELKVDGYSHYVNFREVEDDLYDVRITTNGSPVTHSKIITFDEDTLWNDVLDFLRNVIYSHSAKEEDTPELNRLILELGSEIFGNNTKPDVATKKLQDKRIDFHLGHLENGFDENRKECLMRATLIGDDVIARYVFSQDYVDLEATFTNHNSTRHYHGVRVRWKSDEGKPEFRNIVNTILALFVFAREVQYEEIYSETKLSIYSDSPILEAFYNDKLVSVTTQETLNALANSYLNSWNSLS